MKRVMRFRMIGRTAVGLAVLAAATAGAVAVQLSGQWSMGGQNPSNLRRQEAETKIGVANVSALAPNWTLNTAGDVSATPTVHERFVYAPDWAGNIYAADRNSGEVQWQRSVVDITGVPASDQFGSPGGIVRTSPAVAGNALIMGDQGGRVGAGANVFALDRSTGNTLWVTHLQGDGQFPYGDDFAIVTQSPVVDDNNPNVV